MKSSPDLSDLTDLHLLILGVLWSKDEASIAQIHEAIESRGVTAKTIATILGRLEKRRLVRHAMRGREGVYRALVTRREALVSRVGSVLDSLFAADETGIGAAALSRKDVKAGDSKRLLELLHKAEKDVRGKQ